MSEKTRDDVRELLIKLDVIDENYGGQERVEKALEAIDQAVAPLVEALISIQGLTHGGDSDIYQIAGEALKGWKP